MAKEHMNGQMEDLIKDNMLWIKKKGMVNIPGYFINIKSDGRKYTGIWKNGK